MKLPIDFAQLSLFEHSKEIYFLFKKYILVLQKDPAGDPA